MARELASEAMPRMIELRRQLHEVPEVGLMLPVTQAIVKAELESLGLTVESDSASSGLSARIPGRTNDTIVLRADMDALPILEANDLPFRSRHDGAMHACGHDLHTSMLMAVASILTRQQPEKTVVLAFQAGEEFDRGAVPLLQHRNLRSVTRAQTFALHVHAMLPPGSVNWRVGPFMGYGDWFAISMTGRGGHASAPHRALNPIPPAARLAAAISDITDLRQQPWPTRVATVTEFLAGSSVNVIPAAAALRGTLRAKDLEAIRALRAQVRELAEAEADASGVGFKVDVTEGYPAVVNDPDATARAVSLAVGLLGSATVAQMPETSMVIEDFAYFTQKWPGCMLYLGAAVPGASAFNHAPEVLFDETAMSAGCAVLLLLAGS